MADTTIGTSVAIATPDLEIIEGQITTTSQQIAAHFNKAHRSVLLAIRRLECSEEFRLHNFVQSSYLNEQGKEQPCYRLTRDGFVFLAMGFTGKDAAQWKEAYITAFNKMEAELQARSQCAVQPDAGRMQAAFDAAAQASASVQKAVFNAVLAGNDEWKFGRWLLAFVEATDTVSLAYVRPMDRGDFISTWPRLVKDVASGECMCTSAELLDMAVACMQRLKHRVPARQAIPA